MPRYRVVHRQTGETWEVEASHPEDARQVVGWPVGVCTVSPDCKVSMIETIGQGEFWWQCPSCDLFYQEWENRYYKADEL